ncbi:hypothetical protein [Caulobacter sp. 17J65-9]|uniref:hypothetical protein n=1 Tax=Caulobacter sp. 17J65-9 TaxID=2709382 RepID=UPI0013C8E46A|nr:hypothetical protein [Caulobacter sp. 17J65-9]NEX93655.1 hypothetical protein [Caulobacter sp. 17J65-9]
MRRGLVIVGACLALTGCLRGLDVDVSGPTAAPVFTVKPSWILERDRPCLDWAKVRDIATNEVVWAIYGGLACPKLSAVTYGLTPSGLTTPTPARPLVPGRIYRAEVHGQGWLGGVVFTCEAERCRKVEP